MCKKKKKKTHTWQFFIKSENEYKLVCSVLWHLGYLMPNPVYTLLWEHYPSYHNGLFSPYLVLRDLAATEAGQSRSAPLQVPSSTSTGRVICGTDLAECISVPGDFLRHQGAFPPGFYPLRGGHRPAPEAPVITGMPTGPPKKVLCHTCPLGGVVIKYCRSISVLSEQYETSYLFYVTLSFLCNIICYLISVFVFSLVTLSGTTTYMNIKYIFINIILITFLNELERIFWH